MKMDGTQRASATARLLGCLVWAGASGNFHTPELTPLRMAPLGTQGVSPSGEEPAEPLALCSVPSSGSPNPAEREQKLCTARLGRRG